MLGYMLTLAFRELRSLNHQIRWTAENWFLEGDVGRVTCKATCEFLGLDYVTVRKAAVRVMGGGR